MIEAIITTLIKHKPPCDAARIRPALIGPTGSGKTTRVMRVAESLGLPALRLLLSTAQPEDILGLPLVKGNTTRWTLPEWAARAAERPCILLLDELDKATGEQLAVALTLLAEGRVRDTVLHPETAMVVAMQPVNRSVFLADETGRAIAARLCFIPTPYDWNYLGEKYGVDLSGLPAGEDIELPLLGVPSARQIDYALSVLQAGYDESVTSMILAGMLQPSTCELLREAWANREAGIPPLADEVARMANEDLKILDMLTVQEIVNGVADLWQHGNPEVWRRTLERVWLEAGEEEAAAYIKNLAEKLAARTEAAGGELEIGAGCTEKEAAKAIEDAAMAIALEWMRRRKALEAKGKSDG